MVKSICEKYKPELSPYIYRPEKTSFLGTHNKNKPLYKRINYLHLGILGLTPLLALYGLFVCEIKMKTLLLSYIYYYITGLGITGGYHRYFAHKSYKALPITEILLLCMGSGAVEGSARWWSRDHRAHHKYVDTDKDPYSSSLGFWHSHIGWMLVKQEKEKIGSTNIIDLNKNKYVMFQHKYYVLFALFFGFILPSIIAGILWNDYKGGFYIAGCLRLVLLHHSTFFVNSLAHYAGEQTYSDGHSSRNSIITALLTLGEGYHNFHHEFPNDYRNGIKWYHYDPTKWFIKGLSLLGLAYDLIENSDENIKRGELQMKHKRLLYEMGQIYWGPEKYDIKHMLKEEFDKEIIINKRKWIIVNGYIIDVSNFMHKHPGGWEILKINIGNDVSEEFKGAIYKHTNNAFNILKTLIVGKIM